MDVSATSSVLNNALTTQKSSTSKTTALNAYGIGEANQPKVELSPQARILNQNAQDQQALQQNASAKKAPSEGKDDRQVNNEFVRVTSSVGEAKQSNNLSTDKATKLYRSIEKML